MMQILLPFLLFISITTFSQKSQLVFGTYKSVFDETGWFGTSLKLNEDSTFEYQFVGDLTNDQFSGNFTMVGDTIKFIYPNYSLVDTFIIARDTIIVKNLIARRHKPRGFLIGRKNRLYRINESGEVVKRSYGKPGARRPIIRRRRLKKGRFYLILSND